MAEKRTKAQLNADKRFKAMGEGERTSKKVATIRKSDGSTFKRKNVNQYGSTEGGNDYTEDRVNRSDKFNNGGGVGNVKDIDTNTGTKIPNEVYFKGKRYFGRAGFINGYNGYTSSKDDGMLCAFTQEKGYQKEKLSLWDDNSKPNYLTDKDGSRIMSKNYRGNSVTFEENGVRNFAKGGSVSKKPKIVRSIFEEEEYEYGKGATVKSKGFCYEIGGL